MKNISNTFVQESISFLFLKVISFHLVSWIYNNFIYLLFFLLNLNQTQKVKQHYNPDCHTHIPSQLTRTKDINSFLYFLLLLLSFYVDVWETPNLHLWHEGSLWSSPCGGWRLSFWRELRGDVWTRQLAWEGGGSYAVVVGTEGESVRIPTPPPPPPPECSLTSSLQPATSPLSLPCQWWQWGVEALSFYFLCFLSHAFICFSYILTISHSSLLFPSPPLCRSHSFGGRNSKGRLWPALSHKGEAWIPFGVNDIWGPNYRGGDPLSGEWVASFPKLDCWGKRREDDSGREGSEFEMPLGWRHRRDDGKMSTKGELSINY